jgi:hypothetical protein
MHHPEAHCDCAAAATPLALRWRCSVCGKSAIMKVSTLAAVCDGEIRRPMNKEPSVHDIVASAFVTESPDIMEGNATYLVNLSVQHMLGAARFSRSVGEIERKHAGAEFGEFWEEIFHISSACIFASVAALEAYANELFFDRAKVFPGYSSPLLDRLWETFEQRSITEKFEFALLLRNRQTMNRGARPYQDVAALIDLRNGLMHFKAEWENEAERHEQISRRLHARFSPSPFLPDRLVFPRRWATHSCTKWAVESCLAFSKEFEQLASLDSRFDVFADRLTP